MKEKDRTGEPLGPFPMLLMFILIQVKILLVLAMINRNVADFVYAGF